MPYRNFDTKEINEIFSYHAPTENERATYEAINKAFIECANKVIPLLPDGPGKTVAVRKLAEARMNCNSSVALKGEF